MTINLQNDIKASVQRQFNQVAANYSTSTVHAQGIDLAEMVKAAHPSGQERVLDAGCGTGHTALTFAPHVAQVIAVDFTQGMLDQGRQLAAERGLDNIEFRLADVEKLDFSDAEFDLIVSRYSAHHWPHPQQALPAFRRILKPGGQFILSDVVSFDDFTARHFCASARTAARSVPCARPQRCTMAGDARRRGFSERACLYLGRAVGFSSVGNTHGNPGPQCPDAPGSLRWRAARSAQRFTSTARLLVRLPGRVAARYAGVLGIGLLGIACLRGPI